MIGPVSEIATNEIIEMFVLLPGLLTCFVSFCLVFEPSIRYMEDTYFGIRG